MAETPGSRDSGGCVRNTAAEGAWESHLWALGTECSHFLPHVN